MKCKVGDKVRFLNDVGGGIVSKVINSKMVNVTDEDGFEIPVMISEIIVVSDTSSTVNTTAKVEVASDSARILEERNLPLENLSAPETDGSDFELSLAFVPLDQTNTTTSDAELYLINDSSYRLMYTVSVWTANHQLRLLGRGDLEADSKELVCERKVADLHSEQTLTISYLFYKGRDYQNQNPGQVSVELNPIKFVRPNSFSENPFFDEKAFIYKLASNIKEEKITIDSKALEKAMSEKDIRKKPHSVPVSESTIEEIDLHIEFLVDNHKGMSNGEILDIQLARFHTALDLGLRSGNKKMVFIHGIGNGKLKHEIRRILDKDYAGKVKYQDASFKEYGYGATLVIL